MYSPVPPRRRRPARSKLIIAAVIAAVIVAVGGWFGSRALQHALSPSADAALAQLRQVPHPAGATEVAHRTLRGGLQTKPSAWLTYRVPGSACQAALATFLTAGAREQGAQAVDPVASFCKPTGKGFESFCLPAVCFFADFMSDHNSSEYTISTGPDAEG